MKRFFPFFLIVLLCAAPAEAAPKKVRIGLVPELAQATVLLMRADDRLQKTLGEDVKVEWRTFDADPAAVEAMLDGGLDIALAGPAPIVRAFVRPGAEPVRVLSGAASGGAALVVRRDVRVADLPDLQGKKIAVPQAGGSQDAALRSWLAASGLRTKEDAGDIQIVQVPGQKLDTAFAKKELDAAWAAEPWVSLLIANGASVFLDESDLWAQGEYATALVVVRKKFLDEDPDTVGKFLETHLEMMGFLADNPEASETAVMAQIAKTSGARPPRAVFDAALKRVRFTAQPMATSLVEQGRSAHTAGLVKAEPDLTGLFDLSLLEDALRRRGTEPEWLTELPVVEMPENGTGGAQAAQEPPLEEAA